MKIEYNKDIKNALALCYTYKIVAHTHTTHKIGGKEGITTTQYIIPINNTLKKQANIQQILFIYKHPPTQTICLTTQEPPEHIQYKILKTRTNKTQTTIQLPPDYLPLTTNTKQKATLKYYPQEKDHYHPQQPLMTLSIWTPTPTNESTAQLTTNNTLLWHITPTNIPKDLKPFLSTKEIEQIQTQNIKQVEVNLNTLKTNLKR